MPREHLPKQTFLSAMKKTHLLSALIALCTCSAAVNQAAGATLWVDGVNQTSGWYDANKKDPGSNDGDNALCWAASASNLVAWWQDKYDTPAGVPNQIDTIWSTYKNNVTADVGGDIHAAILWWVTGVYQPTTTEEWNRSIFSIYDSSTLPAWDGYYFADYGDKMLKYLDYEELKWVYPLEDFLCATDRQTVTSDNIVSLLTQGCGLGLGLSQDGNSDFGHAITLWGIEYNSDTNDISRMWLTDSDDAQYNFGQDGLFAVDVTSRDNKLYISTPDNIWYKKAENIYISNLFAINPAVSTEWGIPLAVPEPTSATLSLMLLAGLASRRRRK